MKNLKKRPKIGNASIYDTDKWYACLLFISQNRDIQLTEVFKCDLSPVPSALFVEYGDIRKGSNAILVKKLAVFSSTPLELTDHNETICHTSWQRNTMLKNFADNFQKLFDRSIDMITVFDRCDKHSFQSHERLRRPKGTTSLNYVEP